jgi:hypothetical protein
MLPQWKERVTGLKHESELWLPISEKKKIIPRNTEQTEIFIHSVCFAKRETLAIPFRAIPLKIKMLGIQFRTIF